jgi:4-hydroxybenzoate polyprenyltransferase
MQSPAEALLRTVVGFLRVQTYLVVCLQFLLAVSIVLANWSYPLDVLVRYELGTLGLCFLCMAVWYIHATAINDLADYEIDKINLKGHGDRPLVVGAADKQVVRSIAIGAGVVGLLAGYAISWQVCALMACVLVLNWVYSMPPFQVSHRGGLAQLLLPLGYVAFPFTLGILALNAPWNQETLLVMAGLYLMFCARVLLKDFRDVKGDKQHGKMTFLLRHSVQTVVQTAVLAYVLGVVILCVQMAAGFIPLLIFPVIFLAGIELALFNKLAGTKTWKEQKPLLAPIGRLMTAQHFLLLLSFLAKSEHMSFITFMLLAGAIAGTFVWSAYMSLQQGYAQAR